MASGFQAAARTAVAKVPLRDFAEAQTRERELLESAAQRGFGCDWAVWRTHQSLIAPSLAAAAPNFGVASLAMSSRGWPVYIRDTGGDITPQGPGIVNVSAAFVVARAPDLSIRATYEQFCAPLLTFLGTIGIKGYLASVHGSFCDGASNIVVGGKKLAGTAQRWRLTRLRDGGPGIAVLAHAAILADLDIDLSVAETNLFYRLCGVNREVDPRQHTSIASLTDSQHAAEPLAVQIISFLERWH